MIESVSNVMIKKVPAVTPWVSVYTVINKMKQLRISGLPVIDNGHLVGIITSRDIRESHPNRLVADTMTKNPVVITPETSLWEAKNLIEQHQIKRLIVVEDDKVAGIIDKTQVYAKIGKYMDSMTGLPRTEYLYQKSIELLKNNHEISIIFIDIDDFGKIDKKFGHVVGDQILRKISQMLRDNVPKSGYLCRYAGDEFAFVWSATQSEAKALANLLVDKIAQEVFCHGIHVSASAGVAGGRRHNTERFKGVESYTVNDLINMASLASTKAKREKRQVVVVESMQLIEVS
ncbi:MAG: GGDEF domain-containing protein [Peptococcaceae bacterium]|nr:GGDEF domain-containing protein [Peptococcaceae bacterium]